VAFDNELSTCAVTQRVSGCYCASARTGDSGGHAKKRDPPKERRRKAGQNEPVPGGTPVSFTVSRGITLNAGGSTVIQQGVDTYYDYVNHMSIAPGTPLVFNFASGTVTVTPLGHERDALPGVNYYMPAATLDASFVFTPVPEPTTMIAGALLLLPFGASTIRGLRKNRAA
jgi:hypothetical protein